jgi:hypothetical protein
MTEHETTTYSTVAKLIAGRQAELGTTDHQIASALGYPNEKIVAMFKAETIRVPVNKVLELAGVLDVDAADLLRQLLGENDPGLLAVIERILGPMTLSQGEIRLLRHIRNAARGRETRTMVIDRDTVVALVIE